MKAGVLGSPISHSLSPHIFSYLSCRNFLPLVYDKLEISPAEFNSFVPHLKEFMGLNVTHPYKEKIMTLLSEVDEQAQRIQSVNVLKNMGIYFKGFNTDIYGVQQVLKNKKINSVVIFGTGGAARAAIVALEGYGVTTINVVTRGQGEVLKKIFPEMKFNFLKPGESIEANLYINATPLGRNRDTPYEKDFQKNAIVFDMVYTPLKTEFLKKGEAQGCEIICGLEMLVYQALKTWEIWFNQDVTDFAPEVIHHLKRRIENLEGIS